MMFLLAIVIFSVVMVSEAKQIERKLAAQS